MTETPTKPHAQILTGNAADDDAFAGGGHTRTATALADTISQIGTRDGAIGLEGSWGTGKSMVIKLAAKALPKGKYDLFTFDLWRHQTDNFRRLFLEEFVAWLEQQKYLTTTEVTHAISRIRDRTQTIGTDRFSLYTWPGLVFLLLLALAPIGYSHLTADAPPVFPGAPPIVPDTVFSGAELAPNHHTHCPVPFCCLGYRTCNQADVESSLAARRYRQIASLCSV
ncbi:P-loop NTPase fold protein [Mesorhizobium terrae]